MKTSATNNNKSNTINILNGHKADDLYKVITNSKYIDSAGTQEFLIEHQKDNIAAALACEAAKNCDKKFLLYLIDCGVDISIPDSKGFTAHYYAKENGNDFNIECIGNN